jgi:hypothetical protein
VSYNREVVLQDKDGRGHSCRLLRHVNGEIFAEFTCKHAGTQIFSTMRLGEGWELWPKLAPLAGT